MKKDVLNHPQSLQLLRYALAALVFHTGASASAEPTWRSWNPLGDAISASGGAGTWSSGATIWWDGSSAVAWPLAEEQALATQARFGSPAGTVSLQGSQMAGGIEFAEPGYVLDIRYGDAARLELSGDIRGDGTIRFPSSGQVSRYSDAVLQRGLHFYGGNPLRVEADLIGTGLHGAPVIGVWGEGTVLTLVGLLKVADDGGQTFVSIAPREGGKIVFSDSAEVDVMLADSLFTRQLWVHGDGSGSIEFAPGFVADRSAGGTQPRGLGSYRISNSTLITHDSAGLPSTRRPDGAGGSQINGHLVFENAPGSRWLVRSEPQIYDAGVWIQQDMTLITEVDLTHTGVSTFATHFGNYWAANAFQTDADGVTIVKQGSAALILAGESAFRPDSVLRVEEGEVRFLTDPSAGIQKSIAPQPAGPNLDLRIRHGGTASLLAPYAELQSLDSFEGTTRIGGEVRVLQDFSQNHQEFIGNSAPPMRPLQPVAASLVFILGAHDTVALHVDGRVTLGGFLQIERADGFNPQPGTRFDIMVHGSRTGGFAALNDFSDLGVVVEYLPDRIRLTTTRAPGRTGIVVDEDFTSGDFRHRGWRLLNNPAQVGFFTTPRHGIPQALVHRVDHGSFTWGVAFLDTPTFRIGPDEVLVQKMTTFSDVANLSPQWYKIEIAVLHADTHAPFGHNRSAELSRNYSSNAGDQWQVFPSLYNDDVSRVNYGHHAGGSTPANLLNADTSMALFRPDGDGSTSRLEVFGSIAQNTDMLIPKPLEHWNTLQISMPRQWRNRDDVLAQGVIRANAQMGMSRLHVGITHRTDANLDYVTDAADFIIWNSYRGQSGTHLQTGDFTNSRTTDAADLSLLRAHLGMVHDPHAGTSLRYPTLGLPGNGDAATFIYYQSSGRMVLQTGETAVSAWQIPSPAALQRPELSNNWWQAHVVGKEQALDGDLNGLQGSMHILTYIPHLQPADFGPVYYGFANGGAAWTSVDVVAIDPDVQPTPATRTILQESFEDLSNWLDLSTAISWTGAPASGSVFQISEGVLNLNDASRTAFMWGDGGMRSFSALDHVFATPIARANNSITIQWRMRWSAINATGENSRVALMFIHDYPSGGLDLSRDARVYDLSKPWFGRPAYQVRVRGGFNPPDAAPYFMYGGGRVADGEFEIAGNPPYWLPGFVSGPGGVTPGTSPTHNYPLNGWLMGTTAPASTHFKDYAYVLHPDKQQLWISTDGGVDWTLHLEMPLPAEAEAPTHPSPPLYRYFDSVEGLRIYFRSPGVGANAANVFIESLQIRVEGDYAAPPAPHYVAWGSYWFGAAFGHEELRESLWDPRLDLAGDGLNNRLKAAMGLSPYQRIADDWLKLLPNPNGTLSFRFPVSTTLGKSSWQIQANDSLDADQWIPVDTSVEHIAIDGNAIIHEVVLPAADPGSTLFYRLAFPAL